ncbi:MAG: undecaprenyl-phosphate glucose phosphotransferase [Betaproteobacteria bacterium]|nr:undecaprenyl-phosphate glucose phosphotransferase [Betaproteobacteria bacterium]
MPVPRGRLKEFSSELTLLQRIADGVLIVGSAALAAWLRFGSASLNSAQAASVVIAMLLAYFAFAELRLYRSWRAGGIVHEIGLLWLGWGGVFLVLTGLLFALHLGAEYSRLWVGTWFALAAALMALAHVGLRLGLRGLRRRGYNVRTVCLVGDGEAAARLFEFADRRAGLGFRVVAWFGVHEVPDAAPLGARGMLGELEGYVESSPVDEVWVAMPLRDEAYLRATFKALRHSAANVRYAPDLYGYELLHHAVSEIGGVPMLDLSVSPMEGVNRLVKRGEDLLLGSLFLLLASPLMLAIALGVKLGSPGPVLFRQRRIGWSGREFVIYKFRTMRQHRRALGELEQARRDDPRITPFGRFLRRTSLDELPQLLNVLQGRMSLVGPRPHAVEHHHLYIDQVPSYASRHMVKPGITGYAQVSGYRGETDTPEKMRRRVEYDMLYIQQWSLALDLKILVLTLFKGLVHKNAY